MNTFASLEAIFTATGPIQLSDDKLEGFSAPGMSGAPIFDSKGRVIGVLSGGGDLPNTHITAFTPISKVMDFINAETR